jgi:hypothetical protein
MDIIPFTLTPEKLFAKDFIPLIQRIERVNPKLLNKSGPIYIKRLQNDVPQLIPDTLINNLLPSTNTKEAKNMDELYKIMEACVPTSLTTTDINAAMSYIAIHCGFWKHAIVRSHIVYISRQVSTEDLGTLITNLKKQRSKGTPQPMLTFINKTEKISLSYLNDALRTAEKALHNS